MATKNASAKAEVTVRKSFTDEDLSGIKSFEDALALFARENVSPESISDYGTGFTVELDKASFVGVPMLFISWEFHESKEYFDEDGKATEFVAAHVITNLGGKAILIDGSTGIYAQLRRVTDARIAAGNPNPQRGLGAQNGLRVSEYVYTDDKGRSSAARTYYIAE